MTCSSKTGSRNRCLPTSSLFVSCRRNQPHHADLLYVRVCCSTSVRWDCCGGQPIDGPTDRPFSYTNPASSLRYIHLSQIKTKPEKELTASSSMFRTRFGSPKTKRARLGAVRKAVKPNRTECSTSGFVGGQMSPVLHVVLQLANSD